MLVQSTLGWLFRRICHDFDDFAARQYFQRSLDGCESQGLRKALGDDYEPRYEVFLPFIDPEQLEIIRYLDQGGNGSVLSAIWNKSGSIGSEMSTTLRVALKHPREDIKQDEARKRFLNEVCITYKR